MIKNKSLTLALGLVTVSTAFLQMPSAKATPAYAKQTGLSCVACHNGVFPQLTDFGRTFKLNGYTLVNMPTINDGGKPPAGDTTTPTTPVLKLLASSSLGGMVQTSYTHENKTEPGTKNGNVEFPQQLSLFYAGQIAPHIGAFIQMTYSQASGGIGMDNTDLRYANTTTIGKKTLNYGITVNNNPGVEDLWNSTPAWGYPYASSSYAPTPAAKTMLQGGLAQQVAGAGAYGLFNNLIYGDITTYTSAQQGHGNPPGATSTMVIKGVAPYARVALQHKWKSSYLEIGTTAMQAKIYPAGVSGPTDNFTDIGVDTQYEYYLPRASVTVHMNLINEKQQLDASNASGAAANPVDKLTAFNANAEIMFKSGLSATLGCFKTDGTSDANLYTPAAISGSAVNSPNSSGVSGELAYLLNKNVNVSLNYVYYSKFNGAKTNYDGNGRNATDNNTAYVCVWVAF